MRLPNSNHIKNKLNAPLICTLKNSKNISVAGSMTLLLAILLPFAFSSLSKAESNKTNTEISDSDSTSKSGHSEVSNMGREPSSQNEFDIQNSEQFESSHNKKKPIVVSDMDDALTIQTSTPEKGQFDIRPKFHFSYLDYSGADSSSTFTRNGFPIYIQLQGLYGITDYHAVEFRMGYSNYSITTSESNKFIAGGSKYDVKVQGFQEFYLGYRGFYDFNFIMLHWGLGYASGFEPFKSDQKNLTISAFNGQNMILPSLAITVPFQSFVFGAIYEYRYAQDGNGEYTSINGGTTTFNIYGGGGQTEKVFFELPKTYHLNFELKHEREYAAQAAASILTPVPLFVPKEALTGGVAMRYGFGNHLDAIPYIGYKTLMNKNEIRDGYTKLDEWLFDLTVRLMF